MKNKKIEPKSGDGKKSSVEEDNTSEQGKNPKVEQEETMKAKDQPEVEPNNEASSSQSNPIPTEKNPCQQASVNTDAESDVSENLLQGQEIEIDQAASIGTSSMDHEISAQDINSTDPCDGPDKNCESQTDIETPPLVLAESPTSNKELDLEIQKMLEEKTLKDVLTVFLGRCREKLTGKVFSSKFKNILDLMNSLDPAHLNSLSLKLFISDLHQKVLAGNDTLSSLEVVAHEIGKYQRGKKRPLEEEPQEINLKSAPKRQCQQEAKNNEAIPLPLKEKGNESSGENKSKKRVVLTSLSLVPRSEAKSTATEESRKTESKTGDVEPEKRSVLTSLGLVRRSEASSSANSDAEVPLESEKEKEPDSQEIEGKETSTQDKMKDSKKKRASGKHIKKLEAALKKCSSEIRRLEEAEVDWDNDEEEEGNYVLCAKYKWWYMQLHRKIAEYN